MHMPYPHESVHRAYEEKRNKSESAPNVDKWQEKSHLVKASEEPLGNEQLHSQPRTVHW